MISDETRRKQSESHRGIKHTEEQKRKLSISGKSQKNLEHLQKLSVENRNKTTHIKTKCAYCGKIMIMTQSKYDKYKNHYCCKKHYLMRERFEETNHKTSETLKGRPKSKETIKKLSQSAKTSPLAQKQMQALHEAQIGKERSIETRYKQSSALLGDKAPCWKGGITPLHTQIRNCIQMADWRKAVFKKDNYKDYFSGCASSYKNPIEAHHMLPFWKILNIYNITTFQEAIKCKPLWDVNNGITLLRSSHKAYHNMYGNDYE